MDGQLLSLSPWLFWSRWLNDLVLPVLFRIQAPWCHPVCFLFTGSIMASLSSFSTLAFPFYFSLALKKANLSMMAASNILVLLQVSWSSAQPRCSGLFAHHHYSHPLPVAHTQWTNYLHSLTVSTSSSTAQRPCHHHSSVCCCHHHYGCII